jgi:hypothetical protein
MLSAPRLDDALGLPTQVGQRHTPLGRKQQARCGDGDFVGAKHVNLWPSKAATPQRRAVFACAADRYSTSLQYARMLLMHTRAKAEEVSRQHNTATSASAQSDRSNLARLGMTNQVDTACVPIQILAPQVSRMQAKQPIQGDALARHRSVQPQQEPQQNSHHLLRCRADQVLQPRCAQGATIVHMADARLQARDRSKTEHLY